jgi:hypothetical protein
LQLEWLINSYLERRRQKREVQTLKKLEKNEGCDKNWRKEKGKEEIMTE